MSRLLKVKLLGFDGLPMDEAALKTLYASDLHFEPERRRIEIAADGTVQIEAPSGPVALHAQLQIPDFGTIWVTADNAGKGYGRRTAPIDFIRDAAAARLADVAAVMAERGVAWSTACRAHTDAAADYVESARRASGEKRAGLHLLSLIRGLWAGELAVVERARSRIARRRMRKGFLFGCNAFSHGPHLKEIRRRFRELLNFGTLPFYLGRLEPEEGKPHYARVDEILAWCERNGIVPKGHPLWWGHQAGIPQWLEGVDWESARRHCRRVVGRSVERYRGRIGMWDAINEAHDWANGLGLTQEQEVAITAIACESIREKDPDAAIVVNVCNSFGDYAADGKVHLGPVYDRVFTPLAYVKEVMDAGVDFDVLGVQLYFPARDMLAISKVLDEYACFGKPVHITELGIATGGRPASSPEEIERINRIEGLWHPPWCEEVQADWAEWFYTVCYARPEIEAITWWDFSDPAFIATGGLVREDGTPKESYHRLRALLHGWGFAGQGGPSRNSGGGA